LNLAQDKKLNEKSKAAIQGLQMVHNEHDKHKVH